MGAPILRVARGPDAGMQIAAAGRVPIGRSAGALALSDTKVSRFHAVVEAGGDRITISDMGSAGGTRLDGVPVTEPVPLAAGAAIEIGGSLLHLLRPARYSAAVAELSLLLVGPQGETRTLPDGARLVVGRDAEADIVIPSKAVSRRHLALTREGDAVLVEDLGSRNGTAVNGRVVEEPRRLAADDEIELRGTGWSIRVGGSGGGQRSAREFVVRLESGGAGRAIHVDGGDAVSVGAVARRAAAFLGAEPTARTTLYSLRDGVLFHPGDRWAAIGVARGEELVVADADVPADAPPGPPRGGARVEVNVPPRTSVVPAPEQFPPPRVPDAATLRGRGLIWQLSGGALGVVGGVVLGAATGNWLFAVLGATAGLGAIVFGILGEQSRRRAAVARFRARLVELDASARAAAERQAELFRAQVLDPCDWAAVTGSTRLWERRADDPDFLRLTLGTGRRRALVEIPPPPPGDPSPLDAELEEIRTARLVEDVPVLGPAAGVLAVVGPRRWLREYAAHLLVEAALTASPHELAIAVLAGSDEWDWTRWLPHLVDRGEPMLARDAASVGERVSALVRGLGERSGRSRLIVVGPGALQRSAPLLAAWRPEHGLLVVLAEDARDVPAAAERAVVRTGEAAELTVPVPDGPVGAFQPVALPVDDAERAALELGRRVDPRLGDAATASAVGLLELVGVRSGGELDPAGSWRRTGGAGLAAVLGTADDGEPVRVDLGEDGPHAMIAGTTGSGKSELLASLLVSLVARYTPEELALFLIDFKGGATFGRFRDSPHVAGVVTDLQGDEAITRRAFVALEAELARRKRVLAAAGVAGVDAYRRAGAPSGPLPSLVVVVDEFALLVQSQPAVKPRLDSVASQGRSLGVHLVLATQSPAGVITPAIRANTNLWLALRVVNEAESRELVGSDAAARIPAGSPGRALLRRGAETEALAFQTARVTIATTGEEDALITVRPFADAAPTGSLPLRVAEDAPTDLDQVLDAVRSAAAALRYPPVAPLWLPPLPARLAPDELPEPVRTGALPVALGLADRPAEQRQEPLVLDLAASHLLVTGGPGSGRSSTLLRVATDLAETLPPARLHLYAIDVAGSLEPLRALPHTGAVVRVDDGELLPRLVARLSRLVEDRRSGAAPREPRLVLLIDDYNVVREALEGAGSPRLPEDFAALLTGGRSAGLALALATASPTDLRIALAGGFGHRVQLRTSEKSDYLALDWRPAGDELPPALPGRAVTAGPLEVQVALPDPERTAALAAAWPVDGAPRPLERMPRRVALPAAGSAGPGRDPVGVGGADLEPVGVETRAGAHLMVLGEVGTGRSTALAAIAAAHLRRPGTTVAVLAARPGPLDALAAGALAFGFAADADAVLTAAEQHPDGCLLVVDDAETLPQPVGDRLERLLRAGRSSGLRAAVSARASDWVRLFDPWVRYLASLRSAIVLSNFAELAPTLELRTLTPSRRPLRGVASSSPAASPRPFSSASSTRPSRSAAPSGRARCGRRRRGRPG